MNDASPGPIRLYALVLLLSAFLMFWVELLVARLLLPLFGGTPGVWTTCLLFFQAALLGGYAYAHGLRHLTPRLQVGLHTALLALASLSLPIAIQSSDPSAVAEAPITSLLALLTFAVGLPFFVVSASAPLLQTWYSRLGRAGSDDPYALYAASNLGSLVALVAYPVAIEPSVGLLTQGRVWSGGFALLGLGVLACGALILRSEPRELPAPATEPPPDRAAKLRWLVLSFVPACLLYGVTTAITIDIAAAPLLWILPLALYLLSFVVAFRFKRRLSRDRAGIILAILLLALCSTFLVDLGRFRPAWFWIGVHLVGVFLASVFLHRDLVDSRPRAAHLTAFYLWIATGGLLAGAFCAVAAPLLFDSVLEYPLGLLCTWVLIVDGREARPASRWPLRAVSLTLGILSAFPLIGFTPRGLAAQLPGYALLLPLGAAIAVGFPWGKLRALHVVVLGVLLGQCALGRAHVLERSRSFFGLHRVVEADGFRHYLSGSTVHGRQFIDPSKAARPLAYYAAEAPMGEAFLAFSGVSPVNTAVLARPQRIAVMGLGVGSLIGHARAGQRWRYLEIDPHVPTIANDTRYFTYLRDASVPYDVVLGDGRKVLEREITDDAPRWDLLCLDAFSSDAVPVHLLTVEAFDTYVERLSPHGILVANLSNRFLELEPLFAAQAEAHGLVGVARRKTHLLASEVKAGLSPSHCIVMARTLRDLAFLEGRPGWRPMTAERVPPWTDDHANLLSILKFGR